MEIIKEPINDLTAYVRIKITESDYVEQVNVELNKVRRLAHLKGFRQGFAPLPLVKKHFGGEVLSKVVEKLVNEKMNDFLANEVSDGRKAMVEPFLSKEKTNYSNFDSDKDFEFVFETAFYPEFSLNLDDSISAPYYKVKLDDSEIETQIDDLRNQYGSSVSVESTEINDLLHVLVSGASVGGIELNVNTTILLKDLPEGKMEQFLNKKIGDEIVVNIRETFVNETDLSSMLKLNKDELQQLPDTLNFQIEKIDRRVPAEFNQEFFDTLTGKDEVHSKEELVQLFMSREESEFDRLSFNLFCSDVESALLEKVNFEVPIDFIERYFSQTHPERYDKKSFENETSMIEQSFKIRYITEGLFTNYNISVTEGDLLEASKSNILSQFSQMGMSVGHDFDLDSAAKKMLVGKEYGNYRDRIVGEVQSGKVAQLFREKAKVDEKIVSKDEFIQIFRSKHNIGSENTDTELVELDEVQQ